MRSRQRTAGFTLVELFAVISVIAILASLLLPALAAAKAKAQSAQCKSNLRQIAIAQALYVADFGAYPYSEWGQWFVLLSPYGGAVGPDDYYRDIPHTPPLWCPSARYGGPETQHRFFDYGYNDGDFEGRGMGLGDNELSGAKHVREADVLNPANMIAFSDSAAIDSYGYIPGRKKLTIGLPWIGTSNQTQTGIPNGTELAYQRHARKFNTAFVDGHIASLKVDTLFFSTEDQDRRRWFRDDQPHREWIE